MLNNERFRKRRKVCVTFVRFVDLTNNYGSQAEET